MLHECRDALDAAKVVLGWTASAVLAAGDEVRLDALVRRPIRHNQGGAHPFYAPLAWIFCLLLGAAFWIAVIRFVI